MSRSGVMSSTGGSFDLNKSLQSHTARRNKKKALCTFTQLHTLHFITLFMMWAVKKMALKQVQLIFEITKIHLMSTPCSHWTKSWEISKTIFDHHPYTLLTKKRQLNTAVKRQ